ncbi:MAG: ABC transporter ATP-binding protein [Deltaproteobacteria bacterium]|nr:ABC transporter ATP-binding protein [Deltaproteobacteria bacterium]
MNLKVKGIEFSYNHHPILDGVSFGLKPGEILGVLGINGAGKSTLLKCINRILKPQAGSILLDDENVKKMRGPEIARHFGYVPQKYTEESLTVFDAVLLGRKPYIKWSASTEDLLIVEDILTRLQLEPLAQRPVDRLSGGELQKVIIARALAQEPEILLLDEPTSNLDLKNQLQVVSIITKVVKEYKISAIVSLHDINLAMRFADHFLMLKEGKVHFLSPKEEVAPEDIEEVYGVKVIISKINEYKIIIPLEGE